MRRKRPARSPAQRFAIISVALATVVLGYYLGNRYQLNELQNTAALMNEQPVEVELVNLPSALREAIVAEDQWLIVLPGEPGLHCDALLEHFVDVVNRLAAWPKIQQRIRFVLLASSGAAGGIRWNHVPWAKVQMLDQETQLALSTQLGIAPIGTRWCQDVQATAALIGPGNQVHALLPLDKPAKIAESVRLIVDTLDPDV